MNNALMRQVLCAGVLVTAFGAHSAFGQTPLKKADVMDDGDLLHRSDVQRELELLDYQVQGMNDSNAHYVQKTKDLQKESLSLRPVVAAERMSELLNDLLRTQYRAIRNPVEAFHEIVILSDEQREKMLTRENELREQLLRKVRGLQERQELEVLNVLTPDQRLEWQKQTGEEFKFETQLRGLQMLRRLL